jgi:hypothetical protein
LGEREKEIRKKGERDREKGRKILGERWRKGERV